MNALSIQNLTVSFAISSGRFQALRDISLDLPEGRIVGIVGESGCGKSTLINAILGLLAENGQIDQGKVIFNGIDLTQVSDAEKQAIRGPGIATVFQDPMGALNPVFKVGRQMINIQYRLGLSAREKHRRAVEILQKVRMPDAEAAMNRYPHQFSGGMQQRIAIAMALLMNPTVLIADEPTTALDATLEVATIELLQELQRDIGCSMLFISHHMGVIAELCHDVAVMYAGEVIERGSVQQIFLEPRHPYTIRLLECDPARKEERSSRLPTIPGEVPRPNALPKGCVFAPRCLIKEAICDTKPFEDWKEGHMARCHLAAS